MPVVQKNSIVRGITNTALPLVLTLVLALTVAPSVLGKDKKDKTDASGNGLATKNAATEKNWYEKLDLSKFVWPNPPAITRIKYLTYWSGEKLAVKGQPKKKASWMERVSGVATGETLESKPRWQLLVPNGVVVDSKGKVYIADSKVRAIFIVDPETGDYSMLKNGTDARFQWLTTLAMDDSDRLFAADAGMKRILVFDQQRKVEATINEGLIDPAGMAIDNENRLLYVADAEQDIILVYDADAPFKLQRKIGTPNKKHTLTSEGDFSKPIGVAVDSDGFVYVTDTWNNRVEVFDADGNFIRTWGKSGDGPGYFARPKGIAVDGDGHIWVADTMQDRVQVFTKEGRLLIWMGGHGMLPGQFQSLIGITIDKNNRVFTTEQYPGRMQMFRYVNDADAKAELERRNAKKNPRGASESTTEQKAPGAATSAAVQQANTPESKAQK